MKYCTHCGKKVVDEAVICLNCGCKTKNGNTVFSSQATLVPNQMHITETPPQLATWAMICGIASFFIGWFALGITAIVLACMSKDETNGTMCSSAKAGYICGIISTVLSLIIFVIIIALITTLSI